MSKSKTKTIRIKGDLWQALRESYKGTNSQRITDALMDNPMIAKAIYMRRTNV